MPNKPIPKIMYIVHYEYKGESNDTPVWEYSREAAVKKFTTMYPQCKFLYIKRSK